MSVLEVRRHAERGPTGALTERGIAAARALAGTRYALVVASPLERAKRTAELIGGRLDATEPGLLPDIGGAGVYGDMAALADWARLLREDAQARTMTDEQLATWSRLVARVGPKDTVLAISHGGIIELPIVALAQRLGARLDGPAFDFLEGARITYDGGALKRIELLRAE
jgi:broad specificity phosphatase PhoE